MAELQGSGPILHNDTHCGWDKNSNKYPSISLESGLAPTRRQAIIWTNDAMMVNLLMHICRAGASTRFTSTSKSTSTCNMCEYEYESEYLIIIWVRVRVRVLVDEYEYKCECRSMINILYSMYRQQIFIVRSLTRVLRFLQTWDKAPTAHCPCKLSLSINICLIILRNLIQWHFNLRFATYWLSWLTLTTCCQFKNQGWQVSSTWWKKPD